MTYICTTILVIIKLSMIKMSVATCYKNSMQADCSEKEIKDNAINAIKINAINKKSNRPMSTEKT